MNWEKALQLSDNDILDKLRAELPQDIPQSVVSSEVLTSPEAYATLENAVVSDENDRRKFNDLIDRKWISYNWYMPLKSRVARLVELLSENNNNNINEYRKFLTGE